MKLYYAPLSSNSRRVTLTAHLLGAKFEGELINLASRDDRVRLTAVNPNNKIPVLVDGDFVLWESHAIMQYLCDKTGGSVAASLYPHDLRARADVNRWLFWSATHLAPVVGPINFEKMWKKFVTGGDADPAIVSRYETFFHTSAKVLDAHLADRSFIVGRELTLADLSIAAMLMYAEKTALPLASYPRIQAFMERARALEAWKATDLPAST